MGIEKRRWRVGNREKSASVNVSASAKKLGFLCREACDVWEPGTGNREPRLPGAFFPCSGFPPSGSGIRGTTVASGHATPGTRPGNRRVISRDDHRVL